MTLFSSVMSVCHSERVEEVQVRVCEARGILELWVMADVLIQDHYSRPWNQFAAGENGF